MPQPDVNKLEATLKETLSEKKINSIGLKTGQSKRLREVTPYRLLLTLLSAFAGHRVETIADLRRRFNYQHQSSTAYKAFYNRLAHKGFAWFLSTIVTELLHKFSLRILQPEPNSPLVRFKDIVIQDGSSYAVKEGLPLSFAGGLSSCSPKVRLHTTLSAFSDLPTHIVLTGNRVGERSCAPDPEWLEGKLLLADRGYASLRYFNALKQFNASFVIRISTCFNGWIRAYYLGRRKRVLKTPMRLNTFLSQHPKNSFDLEVEFGNRKKGTACVYRVVAYPGKEKYHTRLCTNLNRDDFSVQLIGQCYRLRWQVELLFKEWKSYGNLHRFNSKNPYVVEGLIWASLAAAILTRFITHAAQSLGPMRMISTRIVSMCIENLVDDLLATLLHCPSSLSNILSQAIRFLVANAARSNPKRDREIGRLSAGLRPAWQGGVYA